MNQPTRSTRDLGIFGAAGTSLSRSSISFCFAPRSGRHRRSSHCASAFLSAEWSPTSISVPAEGGLRAGEPASSHSSGCNTFERVTIRCFDGLGRGWPRMALSRVPCCAVRLLFHDPLSSRIASVMQRGGCVVQHNDYAKAYAMRKTTCRP